MVIDSRYLNSVGSVTGSKAENPIRPGQVKSQGGFDSILQEKIEQNSGLKFSKHAELRLQSRNIHLTENQKDKISQAVKKAEAKGVKDSLVLMENMAFVVNVKNKTVITAVNRDELKDNVFTNIDGAVIA
ncbi:MAG: TIGR02530 family flagellar biosynthesis protein [Clostridiales bacterium]|jgi:flagellar operon protein|nr:flagellar biosynthesis protein [Eubacteriales bacterium]MDH7565005.1 TIGR02530 family flagellar biosynthesis protein [Clostridiales bacterium]